MKPLPCRMIASQAQKALQSKSISAIFLVCDMPHSTKPHWQRFASSVQNSSRSHRSLCPTFRTMEQSPASLPNFPCLATRTNKAIRPSQLLEIFQAGSLGAKLFLKFHHCTRVIFLHIRERHIWYFWKDFIAVGSHKFRCMVTVRQDQINFLMDVFRPASLFGP
jgi:hypothetical protein